MSSEHPSACTAAWSKRSRKLFKVSFSPCFILNRWEAPSLLVFDPRKAEMKASANCLKHLMDPGGSLRYHYRAAPDRVRQKDLHKAASLAFCMCMSVW